MQVHGAAHHLGNIHRRGNVRRCIVRAEHDMLRADAKLDRLRSRVLVAQRLLLVFRQIDMRIVQRNIVALVVLLEARVEEVHLRRADEARNKEVRRMVEYFLRRADLLNVTILHDDDTVTQRHGLGLVMGDVDEGGVDALAQLDDLRAHLVSELCVQVGKRLIHQEHLRVAHDCAADGNALALAAGKRLGLTVKVLRDAQDLRRFAHLLIDDFLVHLAQVQRESHVFIDGHVRVKRVVLENHRDVAVLGRNVVHALVADIEIAAADLLKAGHHAKRGGFSAAGRANEHDEFLVRDFKVEFLHRDDVLVVHLFDVFECDLCHVPGFGGRASAPFASHAQASCAVHYGRSPHCRTASRAG